MELKAMLPEIEAAAVRGWPALETKSIAGWLWRQTSGGSVRANSVATLAAPAGEVDAAIDEVERMARTRGVVACFSISDVSMPPDLDAVLAKRGYVRGDDHVTMAKIVAEGAALPEGVAARREPSPGWMTTYLSGLSMNRRAMAPSILKGLPENAWYVGAEIDGVISSTGLTIGDGRVASVQCMATLEVARRRGGALKVLSAIEYLAARAGHDVVYLQTSGDNVSAQALYRRAGFTVIGHYHTRSKVLTGT